MRHRLQCPSGPERGGKEAKPTLRVLHRGDLSRLPHRASFHLELTSRAYPTTLFSRAPGSIRACPLQAIYLEAQENPRWSPPRRWGGAGRGAQARWAPGWAEEAPCSTPDAITLPESRRVSRITAETLPRQLPPLRPSPVACFLGSFPWRPAGRSREVTSQPADYLDVPIVRGGLQSILQLLEGNSLSYFQGGLAGLEHWL